MRQFLLAVCVIAGAAAAQEPGGDMGGYTSMQIDAGRFKGTFGKGMAIKEMTDGVRITLTSKDPGMTPLPIRAYTMKFDYAEGATKPSKIIMEGNVEVQHAMGTITSEKAEWDFGTGMLIFSGSPLINSDKVKNLRGSEIIFNFKTNEFEVKNMSVAEANFEGFGGAAGGGGDGAALTESAVGDWAAFLKALQTQAAAEAASPGKQLVGLLDKGARAALMNTPAADLAAKKGDVAKMLNKVLRSAKLYNEAAWKGVEIGEEAKALLAKGALQGGEQTKLNLLLLQAAYPEYMKK